jgi:hypothetical protein
MLCLRHSGFCQRTIDVVCIAFRGCHERRFKRFHTCCPRNPDRPPSPQDHRSALRSCIGRSFLRGRFWPGFERRTFLTGCYGARTQAIGRPTLPFDHGRTRDRRSSLERFQAMRRPVRVKKTRQPRAPVSILSKRKRLWKTAIHQIQFLADAGDTLRDACGEVLVRFEFSRRLA